ncbi:MAG TPA: transposase [Candidatus Limnocylindria bacterium]|nr:transposase [Candidatus Limnocylindria bacterium]
MHEAIGAEIALVGRRLAEVALADERVERLMTIPGVGRTTALSLIAVIGDVQRFRRPGKLVSYLGPDPKAVVRLSAKRMLMDARGRLTTVRKPPVGSSSLPVGSEFRERIRELLPPSLALCNSCAATGRARYSSAWIPTPFRL